MRYKPHPKNKGYLGRTPPDWLLFFEGVDLKRWHEVDMSRMGEWEMTDEEFNYICHRGEK